MNSYRLLSQRYSILKQFNRNLKFFKSKSESTVNEAELKAANAVNKETSTPSTAVSESPGQSIIPTRIFKNLPAYLTPRKIWVENLDTLEATNLGILSVHPEVFGARPRLDIIHQNVEWQNKYKYVDYTCLPAKHEIKRSTRKPWPQKGTGRARHGTRRSPLFLGGVKIHGPRGPRTYYYMPPPMIRVGGLCSTLSVKLIQDDLHVVNNLEIPVDDPQYLLDLAETRKWGPAVLFVDVNDIMPQNIVVASNSIQHMNLMPAYGLNVYSMLKHVTLVLTVDAVIKLEEKLSSYLYSPYNYETLPKMLHM